MYDFRRSDDPLYGPSASTLRRPFQLLVHLCASHRKTLLKILRGHYDKVSWNAPTLASAIGADKIPKATFSSSVAGQPDGTAAKLVLIRTGMDCNAYFTQVVMRDKKLLKLILEGGKSQKGGSVPPARALVPPHSAFAFWRTTWVRSKFSKYRHDAGSELF
ncbi:MAG: hypothetical protein MHM6MM_003645 [Cercozoa sp. M6MM]